MEIAGMQNYSARDGPFLMESVIKPLSRLENKQKYYYEKMDSV